MIWWNTWAIPTASVGAPPARFSTEGSPMSLAVCRICSGLMTKPHELTVAAAWAVTSFSDAMIIGASSVPKRCRSGMVMPSAAGGVFMAKYRPGSIIEAATNAMMATKDSISIAP
ncbi:hypothetical protein D3C71_1806100 [compost metagenome]